MSQSKLMSFYEAKTNAVTGLLVSYLFTFYGLPMFGIEPDEPTALMITASYFTLSLVRSFVLRRLFNMAAGA